MKYVHSEKAPQAIGPYSQAVVSGNHIYTTGQIALNTHGELVGDDISRQTEQVLANLEHILQSAGSSLDKVVRKTVFITKMSDFARVNAVFSSAFGDHKPARSTVEVAALPLNALISIDVVAEI